MSLVGDHKCAAAGWARLFHGLLPGDKITIRVSGTAIEGASFTGFTPNNISFMTRRTGHPDLLEIGFGIPAIREVAAADELSKASPTDDQIMTALRAASAYFFHLYFPFRHGFFCM